MNRTNLILLIIFGIGFILCLFNIWYLLLGVLLIVCVLVVCIAKALTKFNNAVFDWIDGAMGIDNGHNNTDNTNNTKSSKGNKWDNNGRLS